MSNPTQRSGGRKNVAANGGGQRRGKKRPRYETPSILTYTGDQGKALGTEQVFGEQPAQGR
jgi:hypothetical protein